MRLYVILFLSRTFILLPISFIVLLFDFPILFDSFLSLPHAHAHTLCLHVPMCVCVCVCSLPPNGSLIAILLI